VITIPLNAKVECADGPCGQSVTVIVNPVTREVTHFVVEDKGLPYPSERLVPVEQVLETSSDLVRLGCTRAQVAEMESFVETQYVDGELLVPASGHITHLILQKGHLFGKREVMLPLTALERVMQETVYLQIDKKAVRQLPSIPVKRRYASGDEAQKRIELIARVFDDPGQASEALEFVEDLQRRRVIKILNAAILVRDADGNATLKDTRDIDPKKGRVMGAITGGLIGLVGGPVGVVVGALAGAGAGGLAGKWIDFGFSDKFLSKAQEYLQPGSSALILLVEDEWVRSVSDSLGDLGGVVLQQALTDKMVEEILKESGAEA
jgi:uncharacterized membrane protein